MYRILKRTLDVLVAITAIVFLLPLFVILVVVLRITGDGDVLFLQRRIGHRNKPFDIIKFVSMVRDSSKMGLGTITIKGDPRVTKLGKFLRKSKMNELPQFFNVIKGDMSFVGPRPLDRRGFEAYPEEVRYSIYDAKPGITGLGSIMFRDEEWYLSNVEDPHTFYREVIAPYKASLELYYQQNVSFLTDFKILLLTVYSVFIPGKINLSNWFAGLPEVPSRLILVKESNGYTPEKTLRKEKVAARSLHKQTA